MVAATVPGMYSGLYQERPSEYGRPYDGAAVQMSAEGARGQTYQITLNGLPDDLPERASGATYTGFVPPPDAVQEVNTQTSLYDAEFGHTSGVLVNTVLKSGTNQYHGEAYWYLRNTILNANCFQCNYAGEPTSPTNWNEPGLLFAGPVRIPGVYNGKNKTFFMVSYEIIRNSNPTPGVTTVPTTAEKDGDFQGLTNGNGSLITIYNPSTTVLNGDGTRTPFPNNIIPPTEIDPVAANLLQYFPNSNVPGNAEGFNNFVYAPNDQVDKYYALAIRLDHQLTENNKLTGIFVRNVRHQIYPTAGLAAVASSGYSLFAITLEAVSTGQASSLQARWWTRAWVSCTILSRYRITEITSTFPRSVFLLRCCQHFRTRLSRISSSRIIQVWVRVEVNSAPPLRSMRAQS